ncbi:MAG: endonuclease [Flavobacteriaceae bacterium]|nr:endonuclease [Flavobacteriaceae bacterium]
MNAGKIRKISNYVIIVLSTLLILTSLASLVHDIPRWYLKILDFPRLHQFLLGLLLLMGFALLNKKWKLASLLLTAGLLSAIFIHFSFISPYLLGDKVVPDANGSEVNSESTVGILIANVLITNKKSGKFKELIGNTDPDMVLAMEVDQWWVEELKYLEKDYPYTMEHPLDNAYGMSLYSKYPITDTEIRFLNHNKVPSFHLKVSLPSGNKINFHGVHPVAPFPSDKYPENIGEQGNEQQKEVELLRVGDIVSENELPSIVAGDFNDVAWSNTSRMFGQNGNLKDVRIGRGLLNTFSAESWFMRWPLDHFFVTGTIKVASFKRLPGIHSDHFPLYAEFLIE